MGDLNYENTERTFSVSYRKTLSHHMPDNHFHSTYEIFYLMSGKREFFIKDRTLVISEGDIVIISPNTLHRTANTAMPKHERLVVNIHECHMRSMDNAYHEVLKPLCEREYIIVKCPPHDFPLMEALASGIIQEMQDQKPGFELYSQTLVLQLLIMCCRHVSQFSIEPTESSSPMHDRMSEVVRYINGHYMHELSLHMLSEIFFISPYYLSRFFKEATGFTYVEYLNSVRVKEAKRLLEQSAMKVNLIAKKVGFGSVTHFGRVFKSVTGHTPMHYRKKK
ncbi:AraC family transcriptional regulator [Neobacillus mesonae]|nr:AraC family transcriptional regulator [Neobacillus mesonae]